MIPMPDRHKYGTIECHNVAIVEFPLDCKSAAVNRQKSTDLRCVGLGLVIRNVQCPAERIEVLRC